MPPLPRRATRRAAVGTVGATALGLLLPLGLAAPAHAATTSICTSASHPALARKLSADIRTALKGRQDTYGLSVWDARTGLYCGLNSARHFDSASVVKATIMATVLRRAQEQHRGLSSWEVSNLRQMITRSDNTAASNLWASVGRTRLRGYLRLAGMSNTVLGSGGYWGLTQITARDEVRLLDTFTDNHSVLNGTWRAYALSLMHQVIPSQRWGTPYGTPAGVTWHVKNGWLPRASRGWRVNSIGVFTSARKDYRFAVLTDNQSTMDYGVTTIERVAAAVHRDLGH
ncbi:serine hydrolase [Streptacidiphilus monticola]|uniref:Beta-lactamase n=1 Tax=Streptacidiphilus monticola TaxID=2161674 RepID=A0ABW1G7H9_9ACTN